MNREKSLLLFTFAIFSREYVQGSHFFVCEESEPSK